MLELVAAMVAGALNGQAQIEETNKLSKMSAVVVQMFLGLCWLKEDQKHLIPPVWLSIFKEKLDKAKHQTLFKCIGKTLATNHTCS